MLDSSVGILSMKFDGMEYTIEGEKVSFLRPTGATAEFARSVFCFAGRVFTVNAVNEIKVAERKDVKRGICIPSSVEIICEFCFSCCQTLSTVSFERESTLSRIEQYAFQCCLSLSSICIPSSVEIICENCFYPQVATSRFGADHDGF
jgi:hypothetical protein